MPDDAGRQPARRVRRHASPVAIPNLRLAAYPHPVEQHVTVAEVREFLDAAQAALAYDLPELEQRAERVLARYRGIPTRVDVFDVLGLHGSENRFTRFIAWFLDPSGTHGLGDRVLRRFLLLTGDHRARALAFRTDNLRAWVRPELTLKNAGRVDLVIVIAGDPGLALIIEAKIWAELGSGDDGRLQTQAYRDRILADGLVEDVLTHADAVRTFGDALEPRSVPAAFVLLAARGDMDPEGAESSGDSALAADMVEQPAIASEDDCAGDPGPAAFTREVHRYHTVRYRDLERALAESMEDVRAPDDVRSLMNQFRTAVLSPGSASGDALAALERLRLLCSRGGRRAEDHIRAQELRRALEDITGDDEDD